MGNSSYIYLLFTRSNTLMSRAIFWFTHDEYTHVSISADDALEDFYSFGRRVPYMMLPAGFTKESVYAGLYRSDSEMPCKLVRIKTEQGEVERIKTILGFFYRYRFQYKYSILGTVFCKLGIRYERMRASFLFTVCKRAAARVQYHAAGSGAFSDQTVGSGAGAVCTYSV